MLSKQPSQLGKLYPLLQTCETEATAAVDHAKGHQESQSVICGTDKFHTAGQ
jgi:hypothetical protein